MKTHVACRFENIEGKLVQKLNQTIPAGLTNSGSLCKCTLSWFCIPPVQ